MYIILVFGNNIITNRRIPSAGQNTEGEKNEIVVPRSPHRGRL